MSISYKDIRCAVVGSINMDIILKAKRIPEIGENVTGTDYEYAFGGKGANQATALAKLGASVKMIGKVGADDNGKALINNLKNNGINTDGVSTEGSQTGLAAILLDGEGRNRIIVYEGANAEIVPSEAIDSMGDDISLLMIQFETNEDSVVKCVNHAIENNITTVIDCGPAKNFNLELMKGATILSPNESETEALTGIFPRDDETILKAAKILKERSDAKYIVLKLGDRGCALYDGGSIKSFPPYKTTVVDTTAAGDCFTAALSLHYVQTGDIEEACRMGNRAGAYAVSKMGAASSMPSREDLENI
jgi:ribokinase